MAKSSVFFFSNLQPVEGDIKYDFRFHSKIRALKALEILYKENFVLTEPQQREYHQCAVQCCYADEDEYPWGTIIDGNGRRRVVCRCYNTKCSEFNDCCPDGLYEHEISPSSEQYELLKYVDSNLKNIRNSEKQLQAVHTLKVVIDEEKGLEIVLEEENSDNGPENGVESSDIYEKTANFISAQQGKQLDHLHEKYNVVAPETSVQPDYSVPSYPSPTKWSDYWLTR